MKMHEIAAALAADLAGHFQTVRLSSLQNSEQFLKELKSLNPDKLPGVIVVFDGLTARSDMILEYRFTLVMIDLFRASSDDRASKVLQSGATLLQLYPPEGKTLTYTGGSATSSIYVHPEDCIPASPDPQYAALALGIVAKEGF